MKRFRFLGAVLAAAVFWTGLITLDAGAQEKEKKAGKEPKIEKGPKKPKVSVEKGKWQVIFDGRSPHRLRGYKRQGFPERGWKIEDGVLKAIPKGEVVDLVSLDQYGDFELQLDWKATPGANSGVMYHVSEEFDEPWHTGPEIQVLDDAKHNDGKNPKTSASAMYALVAAKDKHLEPVGEWNRFRLVVVGKHVRHWLNGEKVLDVNTGSEKHRERIKGSKFAQLPKFDALAEGHIVLQHHTDEVWYKNVRIRPLKVLSSEARD